MASAAALIGGPYYTALKEYGAAKPTFRGAVTVISPNPPSSFDDGDVGDLVWNCIDANIFPEPDDPGGRIFYCVLIPPGTHYGPGGALGAHSWPHDYDFPFDWDTAWVAWVGFASLNTMTRVFGHELAEAATDPEGDGWHTDHERRGDRRHLQHPAGLRQRRLGRGLLVAPAERVRHPSEHRHARCRPWRG